MLLMSIPLLSFCQSDSINVLFIGNSYTSSNNLPGIISSIASSKGDYMNFESNLIGGATLQDHVNNNNTIDLIMNGNWDYVVLQEQSQYPSFPIEQVEQEVFPYANQLSQITKDSNDCSNVIFFMTWGRENGDQDNCSNWPPICTYEGMDDLLRERYLTMANNNEAQISPVGAVWRSIRDSNYNIDLYSSDGSHPSFIGSYIAAVCFYTTLFQKNPVDIVLGQELGLNMNDVTIINEVVKSIVFDNLDSWNIISNDIDNDGICNNLDNCPDNYNPYQEDFNNDDVGDACDEIFLIEKDANKKLLYCVDFLSRENNNSKGLKLEFYNDNSIEKKCVIR